MLAELCWAYTPCLCWRKETIFNTHDHGSQLDFLKISQPTLWRIVSMGIASNLKPFHILWFFAGDQLAVAVVGLHAARVYVLKKMLGRWSIFPVDVDVYSHGSPLLLNAEGLKVNITCHCWHICGHLYLGSSAGNLMVCSPLKSEALTPGFKTTRMVAVDNCSPVDKPLFTNMDVGVAALASTQTSLLVIGDDGEVCTCFAVSEMSK